MGPLKALMSKLVGMRGAKQPTKPQLGGGPVGGGRQMPPYLQLRRNMSQLASTRGDRMQEVRKRMGM